MNVKLTGKEKRWIMYDVGNKGNRGQPPQPHAGG